jgi:hypothetical protein
MRAALVDRLPASVSKTLAPGCGSAENELATPGHTTTASENGTTVPAPVSDEPSELTTRPLHMLRCEPVRLSPEEGGGQCGDPREGVGWRTGTLRVPKLCSDPFIKAICRRNRVLRSHNRRREQI